MLNYGQNLAANYIRGEISEILTRVRWSNNRDGIIPKDILGSIVLRAPDGYATKYLSVSHKAIQAIEAILESDAIERNKKIS